MKIIYFVKRFIIFHSDGLVAGKTDLMKAYPFLSFFLVKHRNLYSLYFNDVKNNKRHQKVAFVNFIIYELR